MDIEYRELRLLVGGSFGGGTLSFKGKSYPFKVGGLGVGGLGASKVSASGEVFDLENVKNFSGTYLATRQGYATGEKGKGSLWLKNSNGVVMRLESKQAGLALSLGADGVVIKMED